MDEERKIYEPAEASLDFEKRFGFPYETLADPEFIAEFQRALKNGEAEYDEVPTGKGTYSRVYFGALDIEGVTVPVAKKVALPNEQAQRKLHTELEAIKLWQEVYGNNPHNHPWSSSFNHMSSLQTPIEGDQAIEMLDLDRLGGRRVEKTWIPSENFFTPLGRKNLLKYLMMAGQMMECWHCLERFPLDVWNKGARVFSNSQGELVGMRTFDYSLADKVKGWKEKQKKFPKLLFAEDEYGRPKAFWGAFPTISIVGQEGQNLGELTMTEIGEKGLQLSDFRIASSDPVLEKVGFVSGVNDVLDRNARDSDYNPFIKLLVVLDEVQKRLPEYQEAIESMSDPEKAIQLLLAKAKDQGSPLRRELIALYQCSDRELDELLEKMEQWFMNLG